MKNNFIPMWVINVTPDSFSDGGIWQKSSSINWASVCAHFSRETILDVGAESTAPGRNAINSAEEMDRLDRYFFSTLNTFKRSLTISIDTYKPEVIAWCVAQLQNYPQVEKIFWNDVSGLYQDQVIDLLKLYPKLHYVLCHNKVVSRSDVLSHTKLGNASSHGTYNIYTEVVNFFFDALNFFKEQSVENKIILDPAFGFAKSREQNWALVEKIPSLIQSFPCNDFLIGISRKSFLRDLNKSYFEHGQAEKTLAQEAYLLGQWMQQVQLCHHMNFQQKIYWRTHHTSLVELLQ
jgi:dihydropteroate synthase